MFAWAHIIAVNVRSDSSSLLLAPRHNGQVQIRVLFTDSIRMNATALQRSPAPVDESPETVSCAVCVARSRLAFRHPEADIYRCTDCGHCFSDVDSVRQQEAYGAVYHEDAHKNWMENPNLKLFAWLETQIRQMGKEVSVLDVGCGRAQFLGYLAQRNPGFRLTGVELDEFAAPAGVTMRTGDFLTLSFPEPFDCVVSQAVIEHVPDVHAFAARAIELTKPGGAIMVMTLNEQSVLYGVARLLRQLGLTGPFNQLYSKHHLNHFTKTSLERLFTDQGVKIERRYDHHIPIAAIDFPEKNWLADTVRKLGAQACFALGELTQRCYLQTIVVRRTS